MSLARSAPEVPPAPAVTWAWPEACPDGEGEGERSPAEAEEEPGAERVMARQHMLPRAISVPYVRQGPSGCGKKGSNQLMLCDFPVLNRPRKGRRAVKIGISLSNRKVY
jgi:hypothetical protein